MSSTLDQPAVLHAAPPANASSESLMVRRERWVVHGTWLLLLLSVLPWSAERGGAGGASLGKGALVAVCAVVVLVGLREPVRGRVPALWWCYFVYGGVAVATALLDGGASAVGQRVVRLVLFMLVPLLMWPALRRSPMLVVEAMFSSYVVLGILTLLGPVLRPAQAWKDGTAFSAGGRLMGAFVPVLPNRVGEFGAMIAGFAIIFWAHRRMSARVGVALILVGFALLYLSRTRTAAGALVVGVVLAALVSVRSPGGRRLGRALLSAGCVALLALPLVLAWVQRGQSSEQLTSLTGRTVAWDYVMNLPVDVMTRLFGHGLGHTAIFIRRADNTLNLAPIDSSWVTIYYESGVVGLALVAVAFLATLYTSLTAPTAIVRACCIFVLAYLAIDGVSETGLSDASPLLLMLMVAAMASDMDRRRRRRAVEARNDRDVAYPVTNQRI